MLRLFNGDYRVAFDSIPDSSIDLCITDPPYKFENAGGGFYAKNNSTHRTYLDSLRQAGCCAFEPTEFLDILKPKMKKFYGYFFCNKTLLVPYITWAQKNKYNYDVLVMAKSNPIPAYNNHHLSDLEYIVLIREKGTYWSKEKDLDRYRKFYMTSCKKTPHPAEKPIELLERFVKVSTKQGMTVLDPFAGSGSTGVACKRNNRNFIGIEINLHYYEMMERRINNE